MSMPQLSFIIAATVAEVAESGHEPVGGLQPCIDCGTDVHGPADEAVRDVHCVCKPCGHKRAEAASKMPGEQLNVGITADVALIALRQQALAIDPASAVKRALVDERPAKAILEVMDVAEAHRPAPGSEGAIGFKAGADASVCATLVAFKEAQREGGLLDGISDEHAIALADLILLANTMLLQRADEPIKQPEPANT